MIHKSKYKKVGILPIWKAKSNVVSNVGRSWSERNMFLSIADEGPTLETLDFAFYIGSTPTFLYFDFYLAQVMILLVFCQVPMYNHLNIVRFFLFYIFILCLWILLLYNYKYTLLLPKYGPINSRFIALRATKRILRSSRDCDEIERLETLIFKFNSMHQSFSYFLRTVVNFADNMVL